MLSGSISSSSSFSSYKLITAACCYILCNVIDLPDITYKGELEVVKEIHNKTITEKKENDDTIGDQTLVDRGSENTGTFPETYRMPFLMLGLDLPPPPLFKDVMEKNIIPQVPDATYLFWIVMYNMKYMSHWDLPLVPSNSNS